MLNRMKVKHQLYLVVAVMTTFMALIAALGLIELKVANGELDDMYVNRVQPLMQLKIVSDTYAVNVVDTTHKLRDGALTWQQADESFAQALKEKEKQWGEYIATYLTPEEKQLADQAVEQMKKADAAVARLQSLVKEQNRDGLREYAAKDMYPAIDPLGDTISKLVELQVRVSKEIYELSIAEYHAAQKHVFILLVVAVIVGGLISGKIISQLVSKLGAEPDDVVAVMQRIAAGDLTAQINMDQRGGNSVMAAAVSMQDKLRDMIQGVVQSSTVLHSSAHSLSVAAEQLSGGIRNQGEATASMAAAVEQMTVSVAHVTDSASEGTRLAIESNEKATEGSQVIQAAAGAIMTVVDSVNTASSQINQLGQESQQISGIVQVIKEVADQTNLLALNAAIEAARAGEHGRGFAVVADEVRKLAERTSSATVEISDFITRMQSSAQTAVDNMGSMVGEVERGAERARQSDETILEIAGMSSQVKQVTNEISVALVEQNNACTEIAQNVQRVAQMADENSSATQVVAGMADEFSAMAATLTANVAYFRTQ